MCQRTYNFAGFSGPLPESRHSKLNIARSSVYHFVPCPAAHGRHLLKAGEDSAERLGEQYSCCVVGERKDKGGMGI